MHSHFFLKDVNIFEGVRPTFFNKRQNQMTYWHTPILDSRQSLLFKISDNKARRLVMQIHAWVWCIIFSFWMGLIVIFGFSTLIHAIQLAGMSITLRVFETDKKRPQNFGVVGRGNGGVHE